MPATSPPQDATRPRAFVLRIWCDADDRLWGQIVEPLKDWRWSFANTNELIQTLVTCMTDPTSDLNAALVEEE